MKMRVICNSFLLLSLSSFLESSLVPIGSGAYTTQLPDGQKSASDQNNNPVIPKVTSQFSQQPQTNHWWSSLIWKYDPVNVYSTNLFAHPLAFRAMSNGLALGYPNKPSVTPDIVAHKGQKLQEYHYNFIQDLLVGIVGLTSADTKVAKYSDWSVTAVWQNNAKSLEATVGHGFPYAYFTISGGDVVIQTSGVSKIWYNQNSVIGLSINDHHYGLFFPQGSIINGTSTIQASLNSKNYFSIAVLPDNSTATLEFYRKHAYAFVTDTKVSWHYNEQTAQLTSKFIITTTLKEDSNNNINHTLTALYRHQWLNSKNKFTKFLYDSPCGQMKVIDSNSFSTTYTFHGILPTLPDVAIEDLDGYSKKQLFDYVDEIYQQPYAARWPNMDTYWSGKDMLRNAMLLQVAQQANHTNAHNVLLQELREKLQGWLDGKAPHLYYYDNTWKALIGYPASFGSDTSFNDHHFHWGYAIIAAGIVARYDADWASDAKWGGMIQLLVKDAANWDRADSRFPFLRMYDAYAGHGWANGPSAFDSGNNQESSSESINFSTGCILFGSATGNKTIRDLGIFLYTTEVSAIQQYWFDIDNTVFPQGFTKPTLGILWGNGGAYAIWWDGTVEELHGINFLPITGGSLHLGLIPDYLKLNQQFMITNNGGNNVWKDIHMAVKSFYDPKAAIADFNAGYAPEAGETKAHTYHWIHSLNALGQIDPTITANIATYAVFIKDSKRTYVAYNPTNASKDVLFSDGTILTVAARTLATSNNKTNNPQFDQSIESVKRIIFKPSWPTQFVYVVYAINDNPKTAYAMTNDCQTWYYLLPQVKAGDKITYSFAYEFNGTTIHSDEYTITA